MVRHDKEALKRGLEHEGDAAREQNPPVGDAVGNQRVARARHPGDRLDEEDRENREHHAEQNDRVDDHRKIAAGERLVPLAERPRDQRAAAGAEHEAECADDHREGKDDIDGGERKISDQVGDEKTVHHAVDRGDDHHHDRRQSEAEQLAVGEVVGELNLHGGAPPLRRRSLRPPA